MQIAKHTHHVLIHSESPWSAGFHLGSGSLVSVTVAASRPRAFFVNMEAGMGTQITIEVRIRKALELMPVIKASYRELTKGLRNSVHYAIELGTHFRVVKKLLPHGEFIDHIEQYYPSYGGVRVIQNWMRASKNFDEISNTKRASYLNNDANLMTLVHYDKLKPSDNGQAGDSTPPIEQALGEPDADDRVFPEQTVPDDEHDEPEDDEVEEDEPPWDAAAAMKDASSEIESFCRHITKEWTDKLPKDPWLKHKGLGDSAYGAIRGAVKTIRQAKCDHICPECKGAENDSCKVCLGTGRIPDSEYNQLGIV